MSRLTTITDYIKLGLTPISDLEVVPHVHHGAFHKGLSGLFLQGRPPHIQRMDISQVIDAADVHPVPGANLHTKTFHHTDA